MPFPSTRRRSLRHSSGDSTIYLEESDEESVIEITEIPPASTRGKRKTSNREDDPKSGYSHGKVEIPPANNRGKHKTGGPKDEQKVKNLTKHVCSSSIKILEERPAKKALRKRQAPDIEEEYISLGSASESTRFHGAKNLKNGTDVLDNQANKMTSSVECVDLLSNDGSFNGQEPTTQDSRKRSKLTAKKRMENNTGADRAGKKPQAKKASKRTARSPNIRAAVASTSTHNDADVDDDCVILWESADILSNYHNIEPRVAQNLITLFDNDNTIPFIARYRRGLTNNMEAEQLRMVRDAYLDLKTVKEKAKSAMSKLKQLGKLTSPVKKSIAAAKSVSELEDIMAQFKGQTKGTLAERAQSLGLANIAHKILHGDREGVQLQNLIKHDTEGLRSIEEILTGIMHIMAEVVYKHEAVLEFIRNCPRNEIMLVSKKMRANKNQAVDAKKHQLNELKFKEFLNYSSRVCYIRPHTAMALNRGESLKILSIKIVPQPNLKCAFIRLCENTFSCLGIGNTLRGKICRSAFEDAWSRLVMPVISRQARSELTRFGEKESLGVFASNLKQILLMPPLKGATVLAIDPGFLHGCKIAVVSPSGEVKHTDVIHPVFKDANLQSSACNKLRELVKKYMAKVIALGDGTASAETSAWLGKLIEKNAFHPIEVSYTIVSERGASIYSCSPVAKEEFPSLDPNVISAVSIGRRLQEPLAELVKIEPKHLGVGMYQHDLADSKLKLTLDEVVQECVSFVGVDLNTASVYLLQKVAGLNESKAKNLLQWRNENGPFTSRQQLLQVKGIGPKAYEQCAGFVRVIPSSRAGAWPGNKTAKKVKVEKDAMPNLLDSTNVHPEAYSSAMSLIRLAQVELEDLGKPEFIHKLSQFVASTGASKIATQIGMEDEQAVMQLTEALTQGPAYDIRLKNAGPVFRSGCTNIKDVKPGDTFTGCVQNVTPFGAFVDIGVGHCGLLHTSMWNGAIILTGQRVEVRVTKVEIARNRIGLALNQ